MKKFVMLSLVFLFSISAFAQYKPSKLYVRGGEICYAKDNQKCFDDIYNIIGEEEYTNYQVGKSLRNAGVATMFTGGGIATLGVVLGLTTYKDNPNAAYTIISGGIGVIIIGIPFYCIGNEKIKHIVERYNLRVTSSGLAFSF